MRLLMLIFICTSFLSAYEIGERLSKAVQKNFVFAKEKTIIVDFFASWCHSCKLELPKLEKLNLPQDTIMIGIDIDKDSTKATRFQKELKLTFPIINDYNQEIVKTFNPIAIPTLYIIKNQRVVAIITGAKTDIDRVVLKKLREIP